MKKLLVFFAVIIYLFSCNTDNSKTKTDKDSTSGITSDTTKPPKRTSKIDITFYELTGEMADRIKNWNAACPPGMQRTPRQVKEIAGVMQAIMDENPGCRFEKVDARLKDMDDENFYCQINKFQANPGNCKVRNNKIWIYKVTCPGYSETYYMFVTLCPPPIDCKIQPDTVRQ